MKNLFLLLFLPALLVLNSCKKNNDEPNDDDEPNYETLKADSISAGGTCLALIRPDGRIKTLGTIGSGANEMTNVRGISNGLTHLLVVKNDGTVWASGANQYGELGIDTVYSDNSHATELFQTHNIFNAKAVAAGARHSLALKNDGTVWAWGDNDFGQLGNNSIVDELEPIQVLGLTDIIAISAGFMHNLALKNDGTVWAWGTNGYGECGVAISSGYEATAVMIPALSGIKQIAAGSYFSLALTNSGTVWTFGANNYGQLAQGTTSTYSSPNLSSNLTGITKIAAGYDHALALKSDGNIVGWGNNIYGQVGNIGTSYYTTPVNYTIEPNIREIACGYNYSSFVDENNVVWGWGNNTSGALGYYYTTSFITFNTILYNPVQLPLQ